ncbi:MAG TPA: N-acetyltransferase [Longimicrobiales bacterium]|nr:N-acetyltransferase [Longimicrobiales bacterium]
MSSPVTDAVCIGGLLPTHRAALERLLRDTGYFRADEIDVALEVFDAYCAAPDTDYSAHAALAADGALAGYVIYGPTPCTVGTWDIYWIAVAPALQRAGVGTLLIDEVERRLRGRARMILVETSGQELYASTRAFYERRGFTEVARVPDFYADGDDRVILARRVL